MTQPDTGNPHALAAIDSLGWAERHPQDEEQAGSRAVTHAALAAAYEQRTANLLAFLAHITGLPMHDRKEAENVLDTIRERLGLNLPN